MQSDIYQWQVQNPLAESPLIIPIQVLCNTPDDELHANIRANSALDLPWLYFKPEHDGIAVLVGGGPSLDEHLGEIRDLVSRGATVFACNGASKHLRLNGIDVVNQIVADAKPETATLVDPGAATHYMASQVDPDTIERGSNVILWHLGIENMEDLFPAERVKRGGYALVGGGAACGNSALCVAYVLGYRNMHCFGYDSSHRGENGHAYPQPMNDVIPTIETQWAGKEYVSSVAMKAQAEKFQITAQRLKQKGCTVTVHGDGLLPAMYNTPPENLSERDKYTLMWQTASYREFSPGEQSVGVFLDTCKPDGMIIDFGCGTGRAGVKMASLGHDVVLVDFTDNCRDEEALNLPFLQWDLAQPCPLRAPHGYCTDVLEHIPPDQLGAVIGNIMESAETVFFQISTTSDTLGALIGERLHLSIHGPFWWRECFEHMGFTIEWQSSSEIDCQFVVSR